jgi:hypothetical protein
MQDLQSKGYGRMVAARSEIKGPDRLNESFSVALILAVRSGSNVPHPSSTSRAPAFLSLSHLSLQSLVYPHTGHGPRWRLVRGEEQNRA